MLQIIVFRRTKLRETVIELKDSRGSETNEQKKLKFTFISMNNKT
jgi:hypothetical protein